MFNFFNNLKVNHLTTDGTNYALSAGTSDVNSQAVDRAGYEYVAFLVVFGDNVDTGTFTAKVQHCDTEGGTYTDVVDDAGNAVTVTFTAGASDTDYKMIGKEVYGTKLKRYVRLAFDRGTANTVIAAVLGICGNAAYKPVAQATGAGQFIAAPTRVHVVS